jgi:hypothetical protein
MRHQLVRPSTEVGKKGIGGLRHLLVLLALVASSSIAAGATVGVGYYSGHIACGGSTALYYSVAGGPANTCGDLYTLRNGTWVVAYGWLCTDSNGNATKGPWYWANVSADQTDNPSYIAWPGGTQTTTDWHIWDKTCPTVTRTSAGGSPPTSFFGTAADTTWGAGFRSNCADSIWTSSSYGYASFRDTTPGFNLYWTPTSGAYSSTSYAYVWENLSGVPGQSISWAASVPSYLAHQSGHSYQWQSCVSDCCCTSCSYYSFTVP